MVLVISRSGCEGLIWVLIASVPDLCILFTFIMNCDQTIGVASSDEIYYIQSHEIQENIDEI